jgi:hypothetical protein
MKEDETGETGKFNIKTFQTKDVKARDYLQDLSKVEG